MDLWVDAEKYSVSHVSGDFLTLLSTVCLLPWKYRKRCLIWCVTPNVVLNDRCAASAKQGKIYK